MGVWFVARKSDDWKKRPGALTPSYARHWFGMWEELIRTAAQWLEYDLIFRNSRGWGRFYFADLTPLCFHRFSLQ
jgi:hypothetical protein